MTTPSNATLHHYGLFALEAEETFDKEDDKHHKPITLPAGYRLLFPIQAEASILGQDAGNQYFGFVARNDATADLVITWRGTEGWQDWVDDVEAFDVIHFTYVPNSGRVHQGFHDVYSSDPCRDPLFEKLAPEVETAKSVHVTGHSLGAALAVLNGLDITYNLGIQPHVWTFAGPRVGHATFRDFFNNTVEDCVRVTNRDDVVPDVPPSLLGYHHVKGKHSVDSEPFAKHNVGCRHSMRSYLHCLDPSTPLQPNCVPD